MDRKEVFLNNVLTRTCRSLFCITETLLQNDVDFMLEFFHSETSWKSSILKPASIASFAIKDIRKGGRYERKNLKTDRGIA
jgi:hypothetical protein